MKYQFLILILISYSLKVFGQKNEKPAKYFGNPIMVDSASMIIIPTRYNVDLLSSSKIALWNDFYSNIIFYNFKEDSSKKLFSSDTYIKGFTNDYTFYNRYGRTNNAENITNKWIFYFVKPNDFNKNGKVDTDDPSILFVSDKFGNGLKAITPENENALSFEVFEKQGFAFIKMQRDLNKDNSFQNDDKDFYFIKLDLNTLAIGNKIEIK